MSKSDELRAALIRNFNEGEWQASTRAPLYDGGRCARLVGPREGMPGRKLGCVLMIWCG